VFSTTLERCLRWRKRDELDRHPVVSALLDIYISRLQMYVTLTFLGKISPGGLQLGVELQELQGWTFRIGHRQWTDQERSDVQGALQKGLGFDEEFATDTTRKVAAMGGGRPPSRRPIAIKAFELKLSKPSISWAKVTAQVCDCGKEKHGEYCQANILTRLKELRKLLRRYNHTLGAVKLTKK
jgi:hypothetical protein